MLGGQPIKVTDGSRLHDPLPAAEPEVDPLDDEELDGLLVQGWQCDDDSKAEWCVRQIRDAQDTLKRWEEHYTRQMEKIRKSQQNRIDTMTVYLRRYLIHQREAGLVKSTKTADSYHLPSALLELKHGTWEYQRDEDTLVQWLRNADMDDYIKVVTKTSPNWAELKKLTTTKETGEIVIKETGEIVEGVRAILKPDTFNIKEG